jgi:multiple sugar transport system permease protein
MAVVGDQNTTLDVLARRRQKRSGIWARNSGLRRFLWASLWLLPCYAGLIGFSAGAVIYSFAISLTRWDIVTTPVWVGTANYANMVLDPLFWKVLGNTFYYTVVSVPVGVALSLMLAIALNQKLKGMTIFRTLYFMPVVSSTVAVALVWDWMFNPQFGLVNYALSLIHVTGLEWLGSTTWAMPALIIVGVWKGLGYNMVIFLAGLQGVAEDLYDAGQIDGANAYQRFLYITIPMISPTTFLVVVLSIVGSFQVFELTYVMTQGGPANSTLTLAYWIFQNAFQFFHMGIAATEAYALFAIVLLFTLLQFLIQKRWVYY